MHLIAREVRVVVDDRFYIVLFSALEQTHCARMRFYMRDSLFIARFLNIHRSGVLTALAWQVPHETAETAAISALSVYTIQPCTMSRHFMQNHIRSVYACLVALLAE